MQVREYIELASKFEIDSMKVQWYISLSLEKRGYTHAIEIKIMSLGELGACYCCCAPLLAAPAM